MTLGVTVLPEWPQYEGIDSLLDKLQNAGVTDIATSPYVMEPSANGTREPPADAGAGKVRLLDRELWGYRAINVCTAPSFTPNKNLYENTRYKPPAANELTDKQGHVVEQFINAAKVRSMKIWFQVQAAIPPGYRVQFAGTRSEDAALGPDGLEGPPRVDQNTSLASADVIEYGKAMMKDLARAYPQIDGVRLDWPEYPPYAFHSLFFDFSKPALIQAERLGIDVDRMRSHTLDLRKLLSTDLTSANLETMGPLNENRLQDALKSYPGVLDLLNLRQHLSLNLIREFRDALPNNMALVPQAFPPPFNLLSGFNYQATSKLVQGIGLKLYTMHWPMILSDWGGAIADNKVGESTLANALIELLDTGQVAPMRLKDFRYPEPHEPHPVSSEAMQRKICVAKKEIEHCPIYAFTHSYGPLDDVVRRAKVCWESSNGQMWVNRYAYLSDEKIAALRELMQRA